MKVQLTFELDDYLQVQDITNLLRNFAYNIETKVLDAPGWTQHFKFEFINDAVIIEFKDENGTELFYQTFDRTDRIGMIKFVRNIAYEQFDCRPGLLECKLFIDEKVKR